MSNVEYIFPSAFTCMEYSIPAEMLYRTREFASGSRVKLLTSVPFASIRT